MAARPNRERQAATVLVAALDEMLDALANATTDRNTDWLRPLAVLSAEIEYTALRGANVDPVNLADECRDVRNLLADSPGAECPFTRRYRQLRRESPKVARLHGRAIAACDVLARSAADPTRVAPRGRLARIVR